jgi:hypothetical protein
MNIVYNDDYTLRVELNKIHTSNDLYHLCLERISSEKKFANSKNDFFMDEDQLKQFIEYLNGVRDDIK